MVRFALLPVAIGSQRGSVHGSVVSIAGHVRSIAIKGIPGNKAKIETRLASCIIGIGARSNFLGITKSIPIGILVDIISQRDREVPFQPGVELVPCLHGNGVSRGIAFIIKGRSGFERAVGVEGEKDVVQFSFPADQGIGNRPSLRIGGIEFTHDGASWLVLSDG